MLFCEYKNLLIVVSAEPNEQKISIFSIFQRDGKISQNTRNMERNKTHNSPIFSVLSPQKVLRKNLVLAKLRDEKDLFQCKIKKISSFTRSPAEVFWLSKPLLLASISLILEIIWRVFMGEYVLMPTI